MQFVDGRHGLAFEPDNNITFAKARPMTRTVRLDTDDEHTPLDRQTMEADNTLVDRDILAGDTDPTPANPTIFNEPCGNKLSGVTCNREADPLRGQNNRCVHADNVTVRIHERASGVTRIERRIGLNDLVEQTSGLRAHRPAESADDTGSDGLLKTIWAADCNRDLADTQSA